MEQTIERMITNVTPRTVTRRSDGRSFTMYDVLLNDGSMWSTSKGQIGNLAGQLIGQEAVLLVDEQFNNGYTNHYLNDVKPKAQTAQGEAVQRAQEAQAIYAPPTTAVSNVTATFVPVPQAEKDRMIHRQTAAKVSATISQTSQEFWANLDDLVHYFSSGEKPGNPQQTTLPDEADGIPF